jgi:hypothetical protein
MQVPSHHAWFVSGQRHTLNEQTSPTRHALPHAPQFAASFDKLTHVPALSHHDVPLGQRHAPPEHTSPLRHALPQEPQFEVVLSDTQVPALAHHACPKGHAQRLLEQSSPGRHAFPHEPQFAGSERRS